MGVPKFKTGPFFSPTKKWSVHFYHRCRFWRNGNRFYFHFPTMREKILLQDWSGKTRFAVWEETWTLATSSPRTVFLGVGANNYPNAIAPFHTHAYLEIFQYPHQLFLNIWSESGLLGLLGFLLISIAILRRTISNSSIPQFFNSFSLPAFLALLEMSIHGLVDVPYFKNDLAILAWLFIIIAMSEEKKLPLQSFGTPQLSDVF